MKLGLGTVQFGLRYGVSNRNPPPGDEEVQQILIAASRAGVTVLDTAPAYGDSELRLGQLIAPQAPWRLFTKTHPLRRTRLSAEDAELLVSAFHKSLKELKRARIAGLLVHHADDLLSEGGELLWRAMERLREQGLVERIGASFYTLDQLQAVEQRYPLSVIQVPANVFDRRFTDSPLVQRLRTAGCEVHARSTFLQGVLLMDPARITGSLRPYVDVVRKFQATARDCGMTPLQAAVQHMERSAVDHYVVGVTSLREFREVLEAASKGPGDDIFAEFTCQDPALLDPSRWRLE